MAQPNVSGKGTPQAMRGAIERSSQQRDKISETVQGYCLAVRSAWIDDGRPPPGRSPGLKLRERLTPPEQQL